jgi:5'-nucleotidase/UDP-sugar diphosphatase
MVQLDGVNVVIGGDLHSLLGDDTTAAFCTALGAYATEITRDDGSVVYVVQAWEYSKVIGQLEVDFDDDENVISRGSHPVFPLNPSKVTVRDPALVAIHAWEMSNGQARR